MLLRGRPDKPRSHVRGRRVVGLSLIVALLAAVAFVALPTAPAHADASTPSWWSGDCDVNNNPNSYALGASYNGVKACGPRPLFTSQDDYLVHFYSGAFGEYEWECVELVMRYMYLVYGIAPYSSPGGKDVVDNYSGSVLSKVTNNGTSLPTPGTS
jgi:hypothetical protein